MAYGIWYILQTGKLKFPHHFHESVKLIKFARGTGPVTNYQPKDLPTKNITHVLYAFGDISEDGTM